MTLVVLDTDVTSRIVEGSLPDTLAVKLIGMQMVISFVTVGELTRWTVLRDLGKRRRALVDTWIGSVAIGASADVARKWGEVTAHAQPRGRPRPFDDSWIAACCLAHDLPLATLNTKHFRDYAEHEGLQVISG